MRSIKYFLSFSVISILLFSTSWLIGLESKPPVSELQRRFMQLEQRALKLSQQIADTTGTEPIQLIDRNESLDPVEIESSAQQSYDSLPGPMVTPLDLPEKQPEESKPSIFQSEVNRVIATTQQRKGDYYFMPIWGLAVATQTTFSENSLDDELDGKWGNSIGLSAGKRWDNWMLYGRIAYQFLEYENPNFEGNVIQTRVNGTEESYSLTFGGGYTIPITNTLSTYGGVGIGFGWRRNSADVEVRIPPDWVPDTNSPNKSQSSLVFTYDFSMGLEYLFKNNFSAVLGYRLLGLSSNHSFEGSFQHLIELGVGANF
jgi:opacity protein-like surface antigen